MKYIIIIFFILVKYIYESKFMNCPSFLGESILIFHNVISSYILFGQLLFPIKYHLIFLIMLWLHWYFNNNECFISQINYLMCPY